eukprot:m.215177 g.215177  ORF g.215177 m.215177 type:complete len:197 (+) comp19084_c0_seq2:237-827(+)
MHLLVQCSILFCAGALTSVMMTTLHTEHDILEFGQYETAVSPWWVIVSCGISGVFIGFAYPMFDKAFSSKPNVEITVSTFVRQLIVFVGLILASVKFSFENNMEMSCTLAFISILVWWIGDRSQIGLILSLLHTLGGTFAVQAFALMGLYRYTDADFAGVRSWLPALLFAGSVTCGNLGRILQEVYVGETKVNKYS